MHYNNLSTIKNYPSKYITRGWLVSFTPTTVAKRWWCLQLLLCSPHKNQMAVVEGLTACVTCVIFPVLYDPKMTGRQSKKQPKKTNNKSTTSSSLHSLPCSLTHCRPRRDNSESRLIKRLQGNRERRACGILKCSNIHTMPSGYPHNLSYSYIRFV